MSCSCEYRILNITYCIHYLFCFPHLGESGQKLGPKSQILVNCAKAAGVNLYTVYAELSDEIHGHSWAGPSLRVVSKSMKEATLRFVICLAQCLDFSIENV